MGIYLTRAQVFQRVVLECLVFLQEFVDLVSGLESKEPRQIGLGEPASGIVGDPHILRPSTKPSPTCRPPVIILQ